jgi:hypothetical protein
MLQRWLDTVRTLEHIQADLRRIHTDILPRSRASIHRSQERCDRSLLLNGSSTDRILNTHDYPETSAHGL